MANIGLNVVFAVKCFVNCSEQQHGDICNSGLRNSGTSSTVRISIFLSVSVSVSCVWPMSFLNIIYTMHNTHIHVYRPFFGDYPSTQVSRYQKGKTNLDFTEARAICKSAPRSRQTTMPAPHHRPLFI